jgi:hypothetical protein
MKGVAGPIQKLVMANAEFNPNPTNTGSNCHIALRVAVLK